ncbi:MAG: NDP-sugar synthase [Deltaproteobacteria bacterium]|nr:NDP-sugar synthase [Deltaproteobacteria bacterium]
MKAMIMAAGFGTRLKPLTDKIPKALVPVLNRPILERNIEYLAGFGIKDIIINAHYHMAQIESYLKGCKIPWVNLSISLEPEILGTGGGLSNCRAFLKDDTFMLINSDILTNIDLDKAVESHKKSGAIVTMVLHDYPLFNQVEVKNNTVNKIYKDAAPGRFAFTGIHVLSPSVFDWLPQKGYSDIISECYRPMIESGKSINAHMVKGHYWYDIGTIDSYIKASLDFLRLENRQIYKGDNLRLDASATVKNWAIIGNNVTIGKDVVIDSSIIMDNVVIKNGTHIKKSIVISDDMIIQT